MLRTVYGVAVLIAIVAAQNYRLDTNIIPSKYILSITPAFNLFEPETTFQATVKITFKTTSASQQIRLHSKNLEYAANSVTITYNSASVTMTATNVTEEDPKTEIRNIAFGSDLVVGTEYTLNIAYNGKLNDDMKGFYRSSYMENNHKIWLLTTQLQATYARRVFPCFDEPHLKAYFEISMTVPLEYEVLSNTKQKNVTVSGPTKLVEFHQTPKMSTYLLAFVVSKFTNRSNNTADFAIWSRNDSNSDTSFAYYEGLNILKEMNQFTNLSYETVQGGPVKMDMVAIPDFSAGAMENWGLLTYREALLLSNSELTSKMQQQRIATVITHEISHQWFGNLITCEKWDYTWLNEGFATYFEYYGTDKVEPTWEIAAQFPLDNIQRAFIKDSSDEAPAMSANVSSPAEISSKFDEISYEKAAAVIRMIENFMGSDKFQVALRKYILNTTTIGTPEALFKYFQDEHNITAPNDEIATYFRSWTTTPGYPIIKVSLSNGAATITQQRFLLNQTAKSDPTNWTIPLTYTIKGGHFSDLKSSNIFLSSQQNISVPLVHANSTTWVIFNNQQSGYYRVNYDKSAWNLIRDALKTENHDNIDPINRAQIVDDILNIARSGIDTQINYKYAFEVLEYLRSEKHYLPWQAALNHFSFLMSRMKENQVANFKEHILWITGNVYDTIGFEPVNATLEKPMNIYLRASLINWACRGRNQHCISESRQRFNLFKNNATRVPVNIRNAVFCSAMREGDMTDFDFLWKKFEVENVATEQITILSALGCAKNAGIVNEYLARVFSEKVRAQDRQISLNSIIAYNEENIDTVLTYFTSNYGSINKTYPVDSIVKYFISISNRFVKQEQFEQLKIFYKNQSDFSTHLVDLDTALEKSGKNLEWAANFLPNVLEGIIRGSAVTNAVSCTLLIFGLFSALIISY